MAVQSVELLPDDDGDAWLRRQWQALADAGLPSLGRSGAPSTGGARPSHRPHLTLLAAGAIDPAVEPGLAAAADAALPLTVVLGPVLVLGHDPCVLARLVVPGAGLLALQDLVRRECGVAGRGGHFGPGEWVSHLTLARRLPRARVPDALATLDGYGERRCALVAMRRWDGVGKVEWRVGGPLPG